MSLDWRITLHNIETMEPNASPSLPTVRRLFGHVWLYRLVRGVIGALFVVAAINKLSDLEAFAYTIWEYDLLDERYIDAVAYSLPVLELLAGVGLLANMRGSLTAVSGMLLLFVGVLWWGILEGLSIDCGCFGGTGEASPQSLKAALHRDIWMLAGCAYCYLWRWRRPDMRLAPDPITWLRRKR